jgi:Hemerythrin HHE cation binding domain
METTTQPTATLPASAAPAGRLDLYAGIHKALRLGMSRTLCAVGSTDPGDADELAQALHGVERLLVLCELHLKHENQFVHPALERAHPGSAARIADEHVHHAEAIADLRDLAGLVAHSSGAPRAGALARLYRALALFVADNLSHMHVEETVHNPLLWSGFSDAELLEIEHAIVGAIEPQAMFEILHWFIPALNAPERAAMLASMRQGMPPEVFGAVLDVARRTLGEPAFAQLVRTLGSCSL